jgi:hypothetical protein
MNQNDKSEVRGPKSEVQGARCLGLSAGFENRQSQIANHPITQWPDDPRARGGCSPSRRCEIIQERAKTSHAKAQRRKGNKAIILCVFAPLRETVYFFTASRRAGRPRYIRRPRYVGGISASTFMARAPGWGGECRTRANGVQSFPPQGPRGSVHRWQGGEGGL